MLTTFYKYPPEIRKIIYTTNIIEGLNRQFRQITQNKPGFTSDDSLRRMLYLASALDLVAAQHRFSTTTAL